MGADVTADSEIPAALARLAGEVKRLKRGCATLATNAQKGKPVTMSALLSLRHG
ncbi:hypothetical protein [Sphingopyxis sp. Root154]|uniref:hypothetical protein n=1 Tax=Sphingopyxis sp. Root154 TaxID=1736476 RepID=UPI00138F9B67|nr:hypothetical protein [Sphingopyxis sp. Root154]